MSDPFSPFERKMRDAGLPDAAIRAFARHYEELRAGHTGMLSRAEIGPVEDVPRGEELGERHAAGAAALDRTAVIKLNGGLGTSMGMRRAKSLLPVKDGLSFLDVIARQVLHLRKAHGARLPLVLMNSYRTREDSLAVLARYPDLAADVPADFLQHKVPRVRADDLAPVVWPAEPEHEWCPPGHGDLYVALQTSGLLDALLSAGYRHAFVSNSDNLGAVLEPGILGWLVEEEIPFLMEVCERSEADRKGGHLARRAAGGLALRESAQCPDDEQGEFQDVKLYRFFNTNNLWLDLRVLAERLRAGGGVLPLPLIRNQKTIDPADPSTPACYQLESAMGAAIEVFEGARAVCVPRRRFAPVKTTSDLLAVWSDAFALDDAWRIADARDPSLGPLVVDLDPGHYRWIHQLEERFPDGPPSLVRCRRLRVRGDVHFGRGVVCEGEVDLRHAGSVPRHVADGSVLRGQT